MCQKGVSPAVPAVLFDLSDVNCDLTSSRNHPRVCGSSRTIALRNIRPFLAFFVPICPVSPHPSDAPSAPRPPSLASPAPDLASVPSGLAAPAAVVGLAVGAYSDRPSLSLSLPNLWEIQS
ncbi:hypothetical protein PAPYR_9996 [Paratrimastix pyriformis]|uniref:Uncharacterized protein n=1 Tax=Paratrimastix pyriformis TaxID=342808 RepID=A0ABQ8U6Y0_9EUKA|nr:hypothetical protein PAPYR_9996 [Paratrimastix pyriformis]